MLAKLIFSDFSLFSRLELRFIDGLNVIIGENSSGKSHLLKLAYVVSALQSETSRNQPPKLNYRLADQIQLLNSKLRPFRAEGKIYNSKTLPTSYGWKGVRGRQVPT
jgi:AAA15 family ATPase/GTPase